MTDAKFSLSIAEVVRSTGIGRTTIFAAIRDGQLVAHKAGRRTVILAGDLAKYVSALPLRETSRSTSQADA